MVQGELSNVNAPSTTTTPTTVVVNHHPQAPSSQLHQHQTLNAQAAAKLYENLNNLNNNAGGTAGGAADPNSEKKKKVGNYIISKTIGEGSFAKVRLGYHLITQQMVAVKVINKREVLKRNYLRANLRREASMMQRMEHPHIIQLYEVMETENCYYIVMELIDGIEFVKYLSKKRSLDENETRDYIRQICSAVDHMHKAKVVHRDIKLQNFMLDQNHNLTIIDFGLSNCLDEREFLNTQCGSPAYAAPEIFAHQDYGPEVDIWSIGVNMYAMLAGKLPFKVENRSKNLAKLHACILKGFEIPPFLSPDCQDLLCRLLDPSPAKRIKMSEIFAHPWINYNCLPIETIPYKPVVDIKELRPEIVQYLVNKHDYTESDIIDAIVYRKPIALKAIYYLIEKRLKQGLQFPDPDFNGLLALDPSAHSQHHHHYSLIRTKSRSMQNNENQQQQQRQQQQQTQHYNNGATVISSGGAQIHSSLSQHQSSASTTATNGTNGSHHHHHGLVKQNSQLLPKRQHMTGAHLATRSSSQKNVDFKSILSNLNNTTGNGNHRLSFTQMNSNGNINGHSSYKENNNGNNHHVIINHHDNNSVGDSNSPSPDFIAAAMSPIKVSTGNANGNNIGSSTVSLSRNSRQTNYQDLINRTTTRQNSTLGSTPSNTSINNLFSSTNNKTMYPTNSDYGGGTLGGRSSTISYSTANNTNNAENRYYIPVSVNNGNNNNNTTTTTSNADDIVPVGSTTTTMTYQYQTKQQPAPHHHYHQTGGVGQQGGGTIRSLPPSVYRGSPERSLPSRSPDRVGSGTVTAAPTEYGSTRPVSRVSSSRPSVVSSSADVATVYDVASVASGGGGAPGSIHSQPKYKVINYLATTKRSMTSCDDATFGDAKQKIAAAAAAATLSKNRQLTMGKAKIDLDTQPNLNVGVSIKSIGTYLKSSLSKGGAENLKSFNSLNIKPGTPTATYKISSSPSPVGPEPSRSRQSTLVHRHSNPAGSLVNLTSSSPSPNVINPSGTLRRQPSSSTAASTPISAESPTNAALPRIKINS